MKSFEIASIISKKIKKEKKTRQSTNYIFKKNSLKNSDFFVRSFIAVSGKKRILGSTVFKTMPKFQLLIVYSVLLYEK